MRSRTFKWGLLLVIAATVGAMLLAFIDHRRAARRPLATVEAIDAAADMNLGKIHQTATRDGIREWDLTAGSAKYRDDRKEVVLEAVAVTFFLEDGQEVALSADRGALQTQSKNIAVDGNVVVTNRGYRMQTEALTYRHEDRIVRADSPVAISGGSLHLTGDSLLIDLAAQEAELRGGVKGSLDVDFTL